MVYNNFGHFICICLVFGVGKLLICSNGKVIQANFLYKIWSLALAVAMALSYFLTTSRVTNFSIKINLEQISKFNDLCVNVCIILLNLVTGKEHCEQLHSIITQLFERMQLSDRTQKILCYKIHISLIVQMFVLVIAIIAEIICTAPPYVNILRLPSFLSTLYVSFHLCLILFILQIMNHIMSDTLLFDGKLINNMEDVSTKTNIIVSIFSSDVKFSFSNGSVDLDLKSLSKMYDDASTCIFNLVKGHSLQMFLATWLTFSSAVVGVTLIACHQSIQPWLEITKSILPFSWCFMVCYTDEQIAKEVKRMETLIVKYLIDYRCDQNTRTVLQTFKQMLTTNSLNFVACNVFHFNYGLVIATIINVITYSIILIQLFLSD